MPAPIWSVLQQALASGSRSTVLKPLGWLIALTLAGTITTIRVNPTSWFSNVLGAMTILSILLYIAAYIYFAITDKDALRSEKFSIQKLAIQKGFIGDDQTGYISLKDGSVSTKAIPFSESEASNEDEK